MKDDFSSGPGRHMINVFSNRKGRADKMRNEFFLRPGLDTKKERRIILRVSPGRQNKDEILKLTDKSLIMNLI